MHHLFGASDVVAQVCQRAIFRLAQHLAVLEQLAAICAITCFSRSNHRAQAPWLAQASRIIKCKHAAMINEIGI